MTITTDLETERRQVQREIDKIEAPQKTRDLLIAKRERLSEQIAAERAAQEAERLAEQRRQDRITSLLHRWEQLQHPMHYSSKSDSLERYVWDVWRIASDLGQMGIQVEPFSIDPLAMARPLVAAQERAAVAVRAMFDVGRASPEEIAVFERRHTLTAELMGEGLDQEQATEIAGLVADEGMELDAARQQVLGADEEDQDDGSEAME